MMRISRPILMVTGAVCMICCRIVIAFNPPFLGLRTDTTTTTNKYVLLLKTTSTSHAIPSQLRCYACSGSCRCRSTSRRRRHTKATELLVLFHSRRTENKQDKTPLQEQFTKQGNTKDFIHSNLMNDPDKKKSTSYAAPDKNHLPHPPTDPTVIHLPWIDDFTMDTNIILQSQYQQQTYQNLTKTGRNTNSTVSESPTNLSTAWNYSDATLLTMEDLQQYLRKNEFVTKKELTSSLDTLMGTRKQSIAEEGVSTRKKFSPISSATYAYVPSKGNVGFPQQSELTDVLFVRCTAFTTGLIALLISRTIAANLWLLGFVVGITYGNQVATHDVEQRSLSMISVEGGSIATTSSSSSRSDGITSKFVLACGKRFGRAILTTYDAINVLWYMYKTGKLSYAYYKQYEVFDSRFHITDKIDAWNLRFQEGKLKFDAWEKEHEISRKLLAGLRTFWTVEEQSLKRTSKKFNPKRRIAVTINNIYSFMTKLLHALGKLMVGGGNAELDSLLKGIQADLNELNFEKVGQQIGSGLSALVAINIVGTLFLKSPAMLGIVCFVGGVIWPTWIGGAYNRLIQKVSDTTHKGRQVMALNQSANEGGRYNYFIREDGTKRWYRAAGTPFSSPLDGFFSFKIEPTTNQKGNNIGSFFDVFRRRNPSEVKAKLRKP